LLPVTIQADKPASLSVVLTPVALPLETVRVSGRDTLKVPAMQGFLERRSRSSGKFFTHEDIEKMHARLFTDILRRVPGMQIQAVTGSNNNGYSVRTGRNGEGVQGGRQCPVLFYMNGMPFPMSADGVINSFISPEEVEAVEVYTGASEIPAQFNATAYNARCGVVLIWTLNGSQEANRR
jgi:outer membrane receptor for Fe3+-dicitrate